MSEHSSRALRPVGIFIPLKVGTGFTVIEDEDADGGAGLIRVELDRVFDFQVALTIEDYGTLGKLIDALSEAQEAELQRIKRKSKAARGERTRRQKSARRGSVAGTGPAPTRPPRKRTRSSK